MLHRPRRTVETTLDGGIDLFATVSVPVTRYRYRGNTISASWRLNHA